MPYVNLNSGFFMYGPNARIYVEGKAPWTPSDRHKPAGYSSSGLEPDNTKWNPELPLGYHLSGEHFTKSWSFCLVSGAYLQRNNRTKLHNLSFSNEDSAQNIKFIDVMGNTKLKLYTPGDLSEFTNINLVKPMIKSMRFWQSRLDFRPYHYLTLTKSTPSDKAQ